MIDSHCHLDHEPLLSDLPNVIKKCLNSKVDLIELNQYMDKIKKSSFSIDLFNLTTSASHIFGIGGFLDNNSSYDIVLPLGKYIEVSQFSSIFLSQIIIVSIMVVLKLSLTCSRDSSPARTAFEILIG